MPLTATKTPKRRRATARVEPEAQLSARSLEQVLQALVALAAGRGEPPHDGAQSDDFERWEDDEAAYLEVKLSDLELPEIDLNTHEDRVVIRISWPSRDDDGGGGGRP